MAVEDLEETTIKAEEEVTVVVITTTITIAIGHRFDATGTRDQSLVLRARATRDHAVVARLLVTEAETVVKTNLGARHRNLIVGVEILQEA